MKILRVKQDDGSIISIPLGSGDVSAHNIDPSAHTDIREQIIQFADKIVNKSSIVQEAGNSETAVMSQKAVTEAIEYAVNNAIATAITTTLNTAV